MIILNKNKFIKRIIPILWLIYMFFLSRRGGDSKDRASLILMVIVLIYSILQNYFEKYKEYKKEIITGIIYLFFVAASYYFSDIKSQDRLYTFTHMTLYSIGFFFIVLNYRLSEKYHKYILVVLLLTTFLPLYYGIRDFIINYKILSNYRIHGDSYTTVYALDLGIYFLIGIFSFICYKNKYIKALLLIYLSIVLILIIGTQSRNVSIMLPLTLIFIAFLKNYKKGIVIVALAFIIGLLAIKGPFPIRAFQRIEQSISTMEKIETDARYILFKEGIEISKKSIVKGKGFYRYKGNEKMLETTEDYEHFHNIFIETAVTQGLLALISYVIFLLTLFYRLVKNYFIENNKLKKNIKLMAVAIFVFSHLYGLAEPIFYFEKLYQLIFTIITISIIIDNPEMDNKERTEEK